MPTLDEETVAEALRNELVRLNEVTRDGLTQRTVQTQVQLFPLLQGWTYRR